jgi:L-fuculose-phosphate aldolase
VGFAPYALPGSEALGRNIAAAFAERSHCLVLENHGVVTGGATLAHALMPSIASKSSNRPPRR